MYSNSFLGASSQENDRFSSDPPSFDRKERAFQILSLYLRTVGFETSDYNNNRFIFVLLFYRYLHDTSLEISDSRHCMDGT